MKAAALKLRAYGRFVAYSFRLQYGWQGLGPYALGRIVAPLAQMIFFVYLGRLAGGSPSYYVLGNAMAVASLSGLFGGLQGFRLDRDFGTMETLVAAPTGKLLNLAGRMTISVVDGWVATIVAMGIGTMLFHISLGHHDVVALIASVAAASFAMSGMGFLLGALSLVARDMLPGANVLYFATLVLSGTNIPLSHLPVVARDLGHIIPLTYIVSATRDVVASGSLLGVAASLGTGLGLGAGYGLCAWVLYVRFEHLARKHGTIDLA